MVRDSLAPRAGTLGAEQTQHTGDACSADAVAMPMYTISAVPGISQCICPWRVTRLQPVALWDLRTDPTPPGMLRRGES